MSQRSTSLTIKSEKEARTKYWLIANAIHQSLSGKNVEYPDSTIVCRRLDSNEIFFNLPDPIKEKIKAGLPNEISFKSHGGMVTIQISETSVKKVVKVAVGLSAEELKLGEEKPKVKPGKRGKNYSSIRVPRQRTTNGRPRGR